MNKDILVCGVGGQGTVLASKLIASAAMNRGFNIHCAETIGMAQRGGPVTSHIRIGEDVFSPLIPKGNADVILAFEPAEAVRNLSYLKADGTVIVNSVPVKPISESLNDTGYDGVEMLEYIKSKCHCIIIDAQTLCAPFGSSKYFNVAILGAAVGADAIGLSADDILGEIESLVSDKFVETNKKAFLSGFENAQSTAQKWG